MCDTPQLQLGWIPEKAFEIKGAVRVREEDKRQILFVRELRKLAIAGEPVLWFHVANELEIKGKAAIVVAIRRRMLGTVPGAPDLFVTVAGKPIFFELKSDRGKPSKDQREFRQWATINGIPYAVIRTPSEGLDIVRAMLPNRKRPPGEAEATAEF